MADRTSPLVFAPALPANSHQRSRSNASKTQPVAEIGRNNAIVVPLDPYPTKEDFTPAGFASPESWILVGNPWPLLLYTESHLHHDGRSRSDEAHPAALPSDQVLT